MTATADITAQPLGASTAKVASRDGIALTCAMTGVLVLFLLLQNPYWVPAGDSEMYTTIARNFASGKGLLFNGQPVRMVPTGWPVILGLAMKVSPAFLFLKLFTMACMVGALAAFYWICRRFTSPAQAACVIVLTAWVSHIYQATIWLTSEASFCLVSAAAILLAMQINEKRPHIWRIVLLIFLCAIGVTIRWTGVLTWLLVAAALVNGQIRPRLDRYWITLIITGFVAAGTFAGLRYAPAYFRSTVVRNSPLAGSGTGEESFPSDDSEDDGIVGNADSSMAVTYPLIPGTGSAAVFINRFINWGHWFSQLLWQPLRMAASDGTVRTISILIGWLVILLLVVEAGRRSMQMQWVWLALMLYTLTLALEWNHPNARYLVPVAPLVILGVFKGLETLVAWFPSRGMKVGRGILAGLFVAALVLCNGALWAVDVYVARSPDFYSRFEAGINTDLLAVMQVLNSRQPGEAEIAVSQRYSNLGKSRRWNPFGLRVTTLFTGKAIRNVPDDFVRNSDPGRSGRFVMWAKNHGVKYFLYQPPVSPWRVFHFRVAWYQQKKTGKPVPEGGDDWRLYYIPPEGREAQRLELPAIQQWPTRVPGL